jgi:UDP-N-acetylmuramoylalanine--D-glutamate ligase
VSAAPARVLVLGLAKTGEDTTVVLRREGVAVTVVEEQPTGSQYQRRAGAVRAAGATLLEGALDRGWDALLAGFDMVVPSPGVHPDHPALVAARSSGVAVRSEIELAAQRIDAPIVAVTGTNGKTTVTALIAAMLEASGRRAIAAGNIGTPLIRFAGSGPATGVDVVVAEVSSFQLEFTEAFRPAVAVLLAVADDHLDWHGSFRAYAEAKARIFAAQGPDDVLVYDRDDLVASELAARAGSRRIAVSLDPSCGDAARVVDGQLLDASGAVITAVALLPRALPHDLSNSLAAACAALEAGATRAGVQKALSAFRTLPHRVTLVGEARGVQYYDDSKATNPHAALHAISGFDSVVLLAGGRNKDLDLGVLATESGRIRAVVAFGEAAAEVEKVFADRRPVVRAESMRDVVRAAAEQARPGDVVLLSPACASWDWYAGGYEARGDDFAAEVARLITELESTPADEVDGNRETR